MRTSLFDFELPEHLIADRPASPRESARMLVVGEALADRHIRDLPEFLQAGDLLVFNDTRVIPARLFGRRGDVKIEVLLHQAMVSSPNVIQMMEKLDPGFRRDDEAAEQWRCFARPAKRLKPGDRIDFAEDFSATVEDKLESGEVVLRFHTKDAPLSAMLERHGRIPLPPYIEQKRAADAQDRADYQTVFARAEGSVAAPTAGLHFTDDMLKALEKRGVAHAYVTLHVGGGTFLPVKAEDTAEHRMHAEMAEISAEAAEKINAARAAGGRVVAVGTTSLRTLESAADADGLVHAMRKATDIFITPGYRFKAVDVLLTNFHLPRSTLFMLVSAFCGRERMQEAYAHAVEEGYRFYSYGDACLLMRQCKMGGLS